MSELTVPKLNSNDDTYILVEWLFRDGDTVPLGADIAVLETSKAAEDLVCEDGGVLHRVAAEKAECRPGDVIGLLFATEAERQRYLGSPAEPATTPAGTSREAEPALVVTESARQLIEAHGVSAEGLRTLGKTVIKRADVAALLSGGQAASTVAQATDTIEVGRHQRAVAEVVDESHRTIPPAFALAKVDVSAAIDVTAQEAERTGVPVGLAELLVKTIAGLRGEFPLCFARVEADLASARLASGSHVAVTIDVGRGLFLPVVRDADSRSLTEIADTLMDFRIKALRGFREEDFADPAIAVSLSHDDGIVFSVPIVFPGLTCMVSLGAATEEFVPDPEGRPLVRRMCHIGLAYDHRVVNGREATQFLQRIRAALQSPDRPVPAGR
jgi:2-oxoglutarate dehydrogenase E2 component (dihydrolipoamide succinyltransferase)